jgi:hypothetical protein
MTKWIVLAVTCAATFAYLSLVGLLGDPRMMFLGFYGAGCAAFGLLYGRWQ